MITQFETALNQRREALYPLFQHLVRLGRPFLLRGDIMDEVAGYCATDPKAEASICDPNLNQWFRQVQEAVVGPNWLCMGVRVGIARWRYIRLHVDEMIAESLSVQEYLELKEKAVLGPGASETRPLEIDTEPFNRGFPKMTKSGSIGRGVEFLNRHLASQMFRDREAAGVRMLRFLKLHQVDGRSLMVNDRITDLAVLEERLREATTLTGRLDPQTPWSELSAPLQELGFEPGWGGTAERALESFELLSELLEAPEASVLERFLSRIPMIFRIAIISPHGWFGQEGVLGRPDTGGQVVYILDQVRALEAHMRRWFADQGVDVTPRILIVTRQIPENEGTTSDVRLERVHGTRNADILRVPFREKSGEVVPHWISRFSVWPYLERFALESERELLAEMGHRPDLVIGNYSDGNLVASILAHRLGVTQANVAHALEKSKYVLSDLYWKDNEEAYHFSTQFTADLIAMNTADFIITSTYQEIAGTEDTAGQYESYSQFSMPGLYRVVNGIDLFDPKFNIVSPGAAADIYFPWFENSRRLPGLHPELLDMLFGENTGACHRGNLVDPDKPVILSMARLDRIKNLTGLVEAFASNETLREQANLIIIGGRDINPDALSDREEQDEARRMHELMDQYGLDQQMRWLAVHLSKPQAGELYRVIADRRGVFVQPALFEAFGLTVIEAMVSGLPTFATCYGGPLEIIQDGSNGFHIDPIHPEQVAQRISTFLTEVRAEPARWDALSHAAVDRVHSRYTWDLYAERLLTLSKVYGFWRFVSDLERHETVRYLEMFYHLQYRPLADSIRSD
ncbi:MAG: sucrose synthase [Nitrospirota bacterium]|nr:sucrose synthase [Nitrospirota bacterium]